LKKAVLLVLDGVGIGEMPDAAEYGDSRSDTLGNTAKAVGGLILPNMQKLGLGNIHPIQGIDPVVSPAASWGKMAEKSKGKDSTTGHWEMMGLQSPVPMPTFPEGFPEEFIKGFSEATGHLILANEVASGTEIIQRFGDEQILTAGLIVYTSADSVFQIAAHESAVPVAELYRCCEIARKMLSSPELRVGRVIARPFSGETGKFERTSRRRDFSLTPPGHTLLDTFAAAGIPVSGVGKVDDLFDHRNIHTVHSGSNREAMDLLLNMNRASEGGFMFANFCDFDSKWGHRNDYRGFAEGLAAVDEWIPSFLTSMNKGDVFVITADHGNDPTTTSTDHSREFVPLLVFSPDCTGVPLGIRSAFSDIACSLADFFGVSNTFAGKSFINEVCSERK